jgi:predicted house-cleaning noncanonical NTP pyrophosphatase (MazG superfamily)
MELLQEKRGFSAFPVDLASKEGQLFVKNISYECADELHEARQHLKCKRHRLTVTGEFDRDAYIEELADAQHYLLEIVIASGISIEEFYEAYTKKDEINVLRISGSY